MPAKKYIVRLSEEERADLEGIVSAKICAQEKRLRAYILLKADVVADGCGWSDDKIKDAYGGSISKIECLRKRFVLEGFTAAVERKVRLNPAHPKKIQGEGEAHLIVLCCSEPPEGRSRWTLRLLADEMVKLNFFDSISCETINKTLKKTNLSLG
jgi:hypothetical protein